MPRKRVPREWSPCEICGAPIPPNPGMPAKTCGPGCAAERHRRRERERYHQIKDTPEWKQARAERIARLKQRIADDPELAERLRAEQRRRLAQWRANLDPEKIEEYRKKKAQWWQQQGEGRREAYRDRSRRWYASLTREEKILHYYEGRRQRSLEALLAIGVALETKVNDD